MAVHTGLCGGRSNSLDPVAAVAGGDQSHTEIASCIDAEPGAAARPKGRVGAGGRLDGPAAAGVSNVESVTRGRRGAAVGKAEAGGGLPHQSAAVGAQDLTRGSTGGAQLGLGDHAVAEVCAEHLAVGDLVAGDRVAGDSHVVDPAVTDVEGDVAGCPAAGQTPAGNHACEVARKAIQGTEPVVENSAEVVVRSLWHDGALLTEILPGKAAIVCEQVARRCVVKDLSLLGANVLTAGEGAEYLGKTMKLPESEAFARYSLPV